jgi:hypothetical protein
MKIAWGSPTIIKLRLLTVAIMIFVLAVLFWPSHTVSVFSVEPGQEATITILGKDFEYKLFVHSVNASTGTAELSVFIPAWSAYSTPGSAYTIYTEQNWTVTLQGFKEGQTYEFKEGVNNGPLFKLEQVDDTQAQFSILDSWMGDDSNIQSMQFSMNEIAQAEPLSVVTDKAKYAQGETVNISITNNASSDTELCSALYRIARLNYSDDRIEGRQLMLDNAGYSANDSFVLHAGEAIGSTWNQMEQVASSEGNGNWSPSQVPPGQYKIEVLPATGNYSGFNSMLMDYCYSRPAEVPLDKCDYSTIIEIE